MSQAPIDSMQPKVLIVDDIPSNLGLICQTLEAENYNIFVAHNGNMALASVHRNAPDLIILDIMMPDIDGYEVCRRLKANEAAAKIPVIFITAKDDQKSVLEGFSAGGVDYITKPFEKTEVQARVRTHLQNAQLTVALRERNSKLEEEIAQRQRAEAERDKAKEAQETTDERLSLMSDQEARQWGIDDFIGKSLTIQKILADVERLQSTGTTAVLITGESGTGKELIARAIHFGGVRAKCSFVPVNCSAIPAELAESMFFGHLRGAFTGASQNHKGYFEMAHGGTLFLDEISDTPCELQAKLLRTLEDSTIIPIGGTKEKQVDIRVVAATNADIQTKVAQGTFREDLYFRLARFPITVPPLRARKEDLPLLISHFLEMFAVDMARPQATLSAGATDMLAAYDFPGNVRELKNIIEGAIIRCTDDLIEPKHLHLMDLPSDNSSSEKLADQQFGKASPLTIKRALSQANGDLEAVARSLEISLDEVYSFLTDEDLILAYVKENGSISNAECRQLLSANMDRAKYLFQKLMHANELARKGASRAVRYYLA